MQSHECRPNWIVMNRNSVRKLCIQLLLCWQQIHGKDWKRFRSPKEKPGFSRFRHKIQHFTMFAFCETASELIQPLLSVGMFRSTWHRSPHSSAIHKIRTNFEQIHFGCCGYGRLPLLRASLCGVVCRSNKNSPAKILFFETNTLGQIAGHIAGFCIQTVSVVHFHDFILFITAPAFVIADCSWTWHTYELQLIDKLIHLI